MALRGTMPLFLVPETNTAALHSAAAALSPKTHDGSVYLGGRGITRGGNGTSSICSTVGNTDS